MNGQMVRSMVGWMDVHNTTTTNNRGSVAKLVLYIFKSVIHTKAQSQSLQKHSHTHPKNIIKTRTERATTNQHTKSKPTHKGREDLQEKEGPDGDRRGLREDDDVVGVVDDAEVDHEGPLVHGGEVQGREVRFLSGGSLSQWL